MKGLCILGSTGSIGQNTLRVVRSLADRFQVVSLCAGNNVEALSRQVIEFNPLMAVVATETCIEPLRHLLKAAGYQRPVRIEAGTAAQVEAATLAQVDFLVSASHGITGLVATYEAIRRGKDVGLASKEVMVAAGDLVTRTACETGSRILPIDSEHGAIHQCQRSGKRDEIRRLILTASGGPFLNTPQKAFDSLTPEQALRHPVWKMGGRITIDSATLMNKGLEVIEAHWLFGLPSAQISILIHPESVVHSMVEFIDGSVIAQLSLADMRIPIQYALTHPDRVAVENDLALDLLSAGRLHFSEPNLRKFPCLRLGREALEAGGAAPCALNAADEVAVEAFLTGRIRFSDIPRVIENVLEETPVLHLDSLERILECDQAARCQARNRVQYLAEQSRTELSSSRSIRLKG